MSFSLDERLAGATTPVARFTEELAAGPTDVEHATSLLESTLLYGTVVEPDYDGLEKLDPSLPLARLLAKLRDEGNHTLHRMVQKWVLVRRVEEPSLFFLRLFNEGLGNSAELVRAFLRENDDTFPYLDLFLQTLAVYQRGDARVNDLLLRRAREEWEPVIRDLVHDSSLPELVRSLPMPLRYYGGGTNTILGLYDQNFQQLFGSFHREAEFLGDLGGGFCTSEINRITGLRFTSVDIRGPNPHDYDPRLLPVRRKLPRGSIFLTGKARESFYREQAQIPWIRWNVLREEPFRELFGERESYGFVSTGMLTSTVTPLDDRARVCGHGYQRTSRLACQRIMELVIAGKDVSLFTVGRPSSRTYHFKTCALRWQKGRLVHFRGMPHFGNRLGFSADERVLDFLHPMRAPRWPLRAGRPLRTATLP